mmetsp:Transcript_99672/g.277276  ORF Transcript_99672/g.277276 Transcript_99672/m.277276 type:complete len:99 (-) Transcript_99672:69-365(-)
MAMELTNGNGDSSSVLVVARPVAMAAAMVPQPINPTLLLVLCSDMILLSGLVVDVGLLLVNLLGEEIDFVVTTTNEKADQIQKVPIMITVTRKARVME